MKRSKEELKKPGNARRPTQSASEIHLEPSAISSVLLRLCGP